ncbi:hypothetical protein Tco_0875651 [Tanacetum coccineum]|uniref:Uncharacterized protein n=1 Tax=Tanacetum coccineum TaxID=301880 RepID=A0ABQ5BQ14_9ASTR
MSNLSKLEFSALNVTGKNYMPWVLDVKMHLESMGIAKTIIENNNNPPQDKAMANIFLHKHIDDGLKLEYLTTEDPSILWKDLKDPFDNQRKVLLPTVREEWRSLRFQDFKKSVTDAVMLEKTYTTFHASNMTLQQQYRLQKFTTLVVEQNNELLMKNHQSRPNGSLACLEVNATKNDTKSFKRGQGQSHGKGRGQFGKNNSHGHNRSFDRNRKNGRVYTHDRRFTRSNGQRTNNNVTQNNKAKM